MTGLVAWTWQGVALAIAASLVLRVCRGLDAASRHALWWGVLATILALPCLQGLLAFVAPATSPAAAPGASTGLDSLPALVIPTPPDWLIAVAIGAWLGTVVLGLLRIALACGFAARVHRTARPLEAHRVERLRLWTAAGPPRRRMALLVSAQVRTACALGWWRPAIVVPPGLLEALDDEELDQIVMHERAHLERADDVWRFVEAVIECVAGLHPAVRLALHHIDLEREAACDDRVVLATGRSDRYAACLADVAATLCAARLTPSLIPGAVRGTRALDARVERLLDRSRARRARVRPIVVAAGLAALAVAAAASAQVDPLVVFERPVEAAGLALAPRHTSVASSPARSRPEAVMPAGPAVADSGRRAAAARARRDGRASSVVLGSAAQRQHGPAAISATLAPPRTATPLASRSLDLTIHAPAAPAARPYTPAHDGVATPWSVAADGGAAIGGAAGRSGAAVGAGARKAGTAVAGFFARTGRAIGSSF